jgi:hypothetical protein
LRKASWRIRTTFGSMPLGPAKPNGEFETIPCPDSLSVGTFGHRFVRALPHVTSSRRLPASTCGPQPVESAVASTWPPRTAGVVSAPPFIGTCVHLIPSWWAICSIVIWSVVPAPGVA